MHVPFEHAEFSSKKKKNLNNLNYYLLAKGGFKWR